MNQFKNISLLTFAALTLASCSKEIITPLPIEVTGANMARLKVVHASAYSVNTPLQIKINDVRVSNNITYSTPFPGGGLNTGGGNYPDYMPLTPGNIKIGLSIPKTGSDADSIPLYNNSVDLTAGKSYTAFIADTAAGTSTVLIEENTAPVDGDFSRFKFVNVIPNSPALDLYFEDQLVASNVAYKGVSNDFTLARGAIGQWKIREAGADPASTPVAIYPSGSSKRTIPNRQIFTVYARGYEGASGTQAPAVSLLYN